MLRLSGGKHFFSSLMKIKLLQALLSSVIYPFNQFLMFTVHLISLRFIFVLFLFHSVNTNTEPTGHRIQLSQAFSILGTNSQNPPFVMQNIEPKKMTQIIIQKGCKFVQSTTRFAIVDNKVFSYAPQRENKQNFRLKDFLNQQSGDLPNMYFLVLSNQSISLQTSDLLSNPSCKSIPFFLDLGLNYSNNEILSNIKKLLIRYSQHQKLILTRKDKLKIFRGTDIHNLFAEKLQLQKLTKFDQNDFHRWQTSLDLITLEETVEEFPFIKSNMNTLTLAQMFSKTTCNNVLINYLIMDNQVYVGSKVFDATRTNHIKFFLQSIIKDRKLPDMYFIVHTNDVMHINHLRMEQHQLCRKMPVFLMNKNSSDFLEQTKFLMPDPYVIPLQWMDNVGKIKKMNVLNKWEIKKKIAFFRGLASGPHYYDLGINNKTDFFKHFHRAAFIQLSHKYPDLIEARFTPHYFAGVGALINETIRRLGDKNILADRVGEDQYSKYRYLLTADGFGAPWRRTPSILFSNSLLLKPYSQKIQWFYDKIIPNLHYIPIKENLSDLVSRIQQMNNDDSKVKEIPLEANKIAEKYLTNEAFKLYMFETLSKYAEIQQLKLSEEAKTMIRSRQDLNQVFIKLRKQAFQQYTENENNEKRKQQKQKNGKEDVAKQNQNEATTINSKIKQKEKKEDVMKQNQNEEPPTQIKVKQKESSKIVEQEDIKKDLKKKEGQKKVKQDSVIDKNQTKEVYFLFLTFFLLCLFPITYLFRQKKKKPIIENKKQAVKDQQQSSSTNTNVVGQNLAI